MYTCTFVHVCLCKIENVCIYIYIHIYIYIYIEREREREKSVDSYVSLHRKKMLDTRLSTSHRLRGLNDKAIAGTLPETIAGDQHQGLVC